METLKPNDQRSKTAILLIWIVLAVGMFLLISSYFQYELLLQVANGQPITMEDANANDTRQRIVAVCYIILLIISAVTFILWFRRAYYNLHIRGVYLSFSEGWAAGAWFVPFVNLVRPHNIMKEMFEETDELLTEKSPGYVPRTSFSIVHWWWALWIIRSITGTVTDQLMKDPTTIDDYLFVTLILIINLILLIPTALVTVKLINDYRAMELLLSEIPVPIDNEGDDTAEE